MDISIDAVIDGSTYVGESYQRGDTLQVWVSVEDGELHLFDEENQTVAQAMGYLYIGLTQSVEDAR